MYDVQLKAQSKTSLRGCFQQCQKIKEMIYNHLRVSSLSFLSDSVILSRQMLSAQTSRGLGALLKL